MTTRTYENIQGGLSILALTFGALLVGGSADFYFLKAETDLSAFGAEFYPALIGVSLSIFAVVMLLKLWGAFAFNGFYLKIQISNFLYKMANKIDPRRKA